MDQLPTGTVTFLYTDLENSTAHWECQPQAMRAADARHDTAARTEMVSPRRRTQWRCRSPSVRRQPPVIAPLARH